MNQILRGYGYTI